MLIRPCAAKKTEQSLPTTKAKAFNYIYAAGVGITIGILTGILGAIVGGVLLKKIPQKQLQKSFAYALLLLGLSMATRSVL